MKIGFVYLHSVIVLVIGSVALLMVAMSAHAACLSTPYSITWTDNFDSPSLDSRWHWIREDATHWSLTDRPGFLRITTQVGGVISLLNDQKNLLLTDAPIGDFQITTKVTISPTENFQSAALLVYQDDDNYVLINRAYAFDNTINFFLEVYGIPTNTQVVAPITTLYLRIVRQGNTYTGYYSTDESIWIPVGKYSTTLVSPDVGISAANNISDVPEIPADFDFFVLEESPFHIFLPTLFNQ